MKYLTKYLAIGLIFATIVETINMGILGDNWNGMFSTLLIFYSIFIMLGYSLRNLRPLSHFIIMGTIGLVLVEWIIIGTPPTASQSVLTFLLFQGGIFVYWATVGLVPRLYLNESENARRIMKNFTRFYFCWFALVYFIGLVFLVGNIRFVFMQVTSALGHLILLWFYYSYFRLAQNNS